MAEPSSMFAIFGLPISTVVGVLIRVGSGVMVKISHVISRTRLLAPIAATAILRVLLGTIAATSRARRLSRVSALARAIGGGPAVLRGDGASGSSLEEVSDRTIYCLQG